MVNPVFVRRPPLNTFERTHVELDTPWTTVATLELYARAETTGHVLGLSETTAILTGIRLANTGTVDRTVDIRVLAVAGPTFRAVVTAQSGVNRLRIERDQRLVSPRVLKLFTASPLAVDPVTPATSTFVNIGRQIAWSPDSALLLVPSSGNRIDIYDIANGGSLVLSSFNVGGLASSTCTGAVWRPSGGRIALSYGGDPYLVAFDVITPSAPSPVSLPSLPALGVSGLSWGGPSGRYLIGAINSTGTPYVLYDWISGSPVRVTFSALSSGGGATAVAWSPNGRYLAVGRSRAPFVQIFDWDSGSPVLLDQTAFTETFIGTPTALAWRPDSVTLVVGGQTAFGRARLHAFSVSGASISRIADPPELPDIPVVRSLAFSMDGSRLCVGHNPAQRYAYYREPLDFVLMYDWPARSRIAKTLMRGVGGSAVAWSPDGTRLAVAEWRYDRHYPPTGVDRVRLIDSSGTDHVVNGSFEDRTGLVSQPFGFTGVGGIPGWISTEPGNTIFLARGRVFNAIPTDGDLWLDLVSQSTPPESSNNVKLEQEFTALTAGADYRIEIDVLGAETSSVAAAVFWNGARVSFNGEQRLPSTVERTLLRGVPVPAGQVVTVPLRRAILAYGDRLQARASGSGVVMSAAWLSATEEEARVE